MKIVINTCYGGFSLSPAAIKALADRKGFSCYFFVSAVGNLDTHIPIDMDKINSDFWSAFTVPNPNDYRDAKPWSEMSDKERRESNRKHNAIRISNRPDNRSDPDLVAVVKKLGRAANGSCAELKIVEIPDGIEWQIKEYDGTEWVAENHRIWR